MPVKVLRPFSWKIFASLTLELFQRCRILSLLKAVYILVDRPMIQSITTWKNYNLYLLKYRKVQA